MIQTILDTSTFATAHLNMRFDEKLFNNSQPNTRICRVYIWENPGITYSYRQQPTWPELEPFDISERITGGGVLFHSAGDVVFSVIAENTDPIFPKPLSQKMAVLTQWISEIFQDLGIKLQSTDEKSTDLNRVFCNTYPSRFELSYANQKILAMTIRRFRQQFMIQGLIHIADNFAQFQLPQSWSPYLSEGIKDPSVSSVEVQNRLLQKLSKDTH